MASLVIELMLVQVIRWLAQHGKSVLALTLQIDKGIKHWKRFESGIVSLVALTPNLQILDLGNATSFFNPSYDMYAFQHLPSLRSLILGFSCGSLWKHSTLQPLSSLSNLKSLELVIDDMRTPLLLDTSLSMLTGLTHLNLSRDSKDVEIMYEVDTDNLVSVVSCLTGLQWLQLEGMLDKLPAALLSLQHLTTLHCGDAYLVSSDVLRSSSMQWGRLERIWLGQVPASAAKYLEINLPNDLDVT